MADTEMSGSGEGVDHGDLESCCMACAANSQCEGFVRYMDEYSVYGTLNCDHLRIFGTLRVFSGARLYVRRITVEASGTFVVGTPSLPAVDVLINMHHDKCVWRDNNGDCTVDGKLISYGTTRMYGQPLTSWTQLEADALPGASQIVVKACNGWQVTDPISIAPTASMYEPHPDLAEEFTVTTISRGEGHCTIGLSGTLLAKHLGSDSKSPGFSVHAEVLMFRRSIRITGPVHSRNDLSSTYGHQGITTVQMSPGSMQYHFVRVDNCGRIALGQYCAHFHWANNCPECKLVGSAFINGCNKGVTIHATQNSLLQDSVIYNVRGAGLYYENGQEMNNTALRNVSRNCVVRNSM
ncbi:MAG: hypothetical protein SGPRY_001593 [Prymnesium sp.]